MARPPVHLLAAIPVLMANMLTPPPVVMPNVTIVLIALVVLIVLIALIGITLIVLVPVGLIVLILCERNAAAEGQRQG
jgi:hypothetical protein